MKAMHIVIFGLSITSAWGNGHATTYRSLVKALARRGHSITFFEKDVPWYSDHRDLTDPFFCRTILYRNLDDLDGHKESIAAADLVILGSYVADAKECAEMVGSLHPSCFAFYDIDTPVTLTKLDRGDYEYLHPFMIPEFDIYLSFTGGPTLARLQSVYGAQRARPLYCSVDPELYYQEIGPAAVTQDRGDKEITLGYLGTYSDDRQPTLEELLLVPARQLPEKRFAVAGAQYPATVDWPGNVEVTSHIPPAEHRRFYNNQRFTLNVTRRDMIRAGHSPSVRLFEAGACGTPVISDTWLGLDSFFKIGEEILVAGSRHEVLDYLHMSEEDRNRIAENFRHKVLQLHTADHRARELEHYWREAALQVPAGGSSGEAI